MAAITAAQLDRALLRRVGGQYAYAGLDSTTADGTNHDLLDCKVEGLRSLGLYPASLDAVTDADLAGVTAEQQGQLLDVAELRAFETVLGNRAAADRKALDSEQYDGRFYSHLELTVTRKRKQVERQYGHGLGSLTSGVFDLGFAATIDPATGRPH